MAQSFLGNAGIAQMLGGSGLVAFGEVGAVLGGVFAIAAAFFIVRKLSSQEVRKEFGA